MARIQVRRIDRGTRDRFRAYKVLIDDQTVGRLKRRESAQFELSPGLHVIQVAIDWKRSATYEVAGDGEETYPFRCGPRNSALLGLIDLFKRGDDTWLLLEPDVD